MPRVPPTNIKTLQKPEIEEENPLGTEIERRDKKKHKTKKGRKGRRKKEKEENQKGKMKKRAILTVKRRLKKAACLQKLPHQDSRGTQVKSSILSLESK